MIKPGVYVEEIAPSDWRVCMSPAIAPPAGQLSTTSYPSKEAALEAAENGRYE
jgi:hypothetical protein